MEIARGGAHLGHRVSQRLASQISQLLQAAGADVRKLVWDKTCRIFSGDSDYPSLGTPMWGGA